jgi:hypothetical protein
VIGRVQDARKEPIGPDDLDRFFKGRTRLLVAKGSKLVDVRLAGLDVEERARLVIGPSGRLRAPTLVRGKTVLVGFHPEGLAELLG